MYSSSYSCIYHHGVDDIGSNIEGSHAATSQGTTQLVKASKTQRSNSSLVSPYVSLYSSLTFLYQLDHEWQQAVCNSSFSTFAS